MSSLKYWVWLSSLSGVGAVTAAALLRQFETPEKIYSAKAADYIKIDGIRKPDITVLMDKNMETVNKTLASCSDIGCHILTLQDAQYPDRLRNIYDPPIILYVKGYLPIIDEEPAVAIVGTRNCTPYGYSAAEKIGYQLARHGIVVVTGLAKGVDTAAARGALRGGGRVVGVIGSGLDIVYPAENRSLFADVAASGAIISEYPPGSSALSTHFPARNRIISGISLGVAVIEAPKRSGALITASRALEQGRDVFALPGNIDAKNSEGANKLLREGAIPILSGEDIIEEYAELFPEKIMQDSQMHSATQDIKSADISKEPSWNGEHRLRDNSKKEIDNVSKVDYIDFDEILKTLAGDDRIVAEAIGRGALSADNLIINSGLPAAQVMTALTMLEINGYATRSGGLWRLRAP